MKILIADGYFEDDHAAERAAAAPFDLELRRATKVADIPADVWASADALVCYHILRYDETVARQLDRCKLVVRAGVGFDNMDLAAFGARGIAVCNTPDYGTTEVADHAIALLMALTRGLFHYHAAVQRDPTNWTAKPAAPALRRLRGQTMLIVGLGNIGLATARRAAALDMDVVFFDPYRPSGFELGTGYRRVDSLEDGLRTADIVSLHAPSTAETSGMIGRDALALMKPGGILINTARGALVDPDAVHDALKSGHLTAAGLDVLPSEPPDPTQPLLRALTAGEPWLAGRLIVTPHSAFASPSAIDDMRMKSLATARQYLATGVLRNCVNRDQLVGLRKP
ncbi:MAG TPA: C-terminal binding protein [Stellaceae bacterium]|nr:C-terminal binding protein [Stellaceae bacterium]